MWNLLKVYQKDGEKRPQPLTEKGRRVIIKIQSLRKEQTDEMILIFDFIIKAQRLN